MTDTTTIDTAVPTTIVVLDPNEVGVHPNVRHDLGDLTDLTRSVKAIGVRVPAVVVAGDDGQFLLVYGQRRRAAAIEAGRSLPAIVVADVDEAERIVSQLAENLYRKDLTPSEEGRAYQLLADLGLSDSTIAKKTGTPKRRVEKSRQVAGNPAASTVADECGLTLDQALVVADFDGDEVAVAMLMDTARQRPGQFDHVASRLRQDRERAEQHAAAVEALTAAGVTVLESRDDNPSVTQLWKLRDGEGEGDDDSEITPEAHAACPGHAAVVSSYNPNDVTYYCLDPDAYGHRVVYQDTTRSTGGPMTEEQKAQRKVVIENNKQWRAAVDVRRTFVRTLLTRKTAPKTMLRFVTEEVLGAPDRMGDGTDGMLADLFGVVDEPGHWGRHVGRVQAEKATDARLPLVLFAQVAADREQAMSEHTWRQANLAAARYFSFLASVGYVLSDIEQSVVDQATAQPEPDMPDDPGLDGEGSHGFDAGLVDDALGVDDAA